MFNLQSRHDIALTYVPRGIIWKIYKQELWFLCMTPRLNVLYKCMKFIWNIFYSYQVAEQHEIALYSKGSNLNQRTNGPVKRSPDIWAKHKIKFGSKWPNHFWENPVLIFKCKWPWPSILTYLHYLNWFQVTGCKSSEKSTVFTFSYR